MTYQLGLLDKSHIPEGATGAEALTTTLDAARLADDLGYHRFWVAEHHGTPSLASAAPEILVSHILARTRHIRVGSGGVLLQHYAPYKVAELFSVLATLAPGRVELGVGKSPGGLPYATRAIQSELAEGSARDLVRKLEELDAWLAGPYRDADIFPRPAVLPDRFLLGGSVDSAVQAARLGWNFVHAGHQDGDRANTLAALDAYETLTGKRPTLAIAAFAAPSRAEAQDRLGELRVVRPVFSDGHAVNLGSEDAAHEYARQYDGSEDYRIEIRKPTAIAGTAEDVHQQIEALQADLRVNDFIIDQPVADRSARLKSIELLALGARRAAA
ncbi:MsnO8 family LLM class oxidoreductase [Paracoccus caeni]|uniref:MsnO8 family LLM class oxidoreductase n=1 Tax=Paracoccus caeni TaxID=657651 RepID=A0A934SK30_9RHOB|nr:MsnO8 family LLM class oxidoreductase [Paracoccus caeni]MBK4216742.1 MsnO8 family LLM class oxidoreductase [Paracoccus caeni]